RCLAAGAQWHAESLIMLCVAPNESHRLAIYGRTSHSRSEFGATKFRWTAARLAEGVDAWESAEGGSAASLFGGGRTASIARYLDNADPSLSDSDLVSSLHPVVRDALTASPRSLDRVEALLQSNEPELYPLVPGEAGPRIGNATAFVFNLDLT